MTNVSFQDVVNVTSEVVEEYGRDFVYTMPDGKQCLYQSEGYPSCLVGHVLNRVGVSIDALVDLDSGEYDDIPEELQAVAETNGVLVDLDALGMLLEAQGYQDNGMPWGDAWDKARAQCVNEEGVAPST